MKPPMRGDLVFGIILGFAAGMLLASAIWYALT